MQTTDVIAITGATGFIASYLTGLLNKAGFTQLILVDDFTRTDKQPNLQGKQYMEQVHRDFFVRWLQSHPGEVKYIFHLGARTDTTEMDYNVHKQLNLDYTKELWQVCAAQNIPLVYASSAATYGNGELGYKDDHDIVSDLKPLNPYGISKNEFDIWALQQTSTPPFWAGLKFFNVYGPNEYHKGRMASVILHAYRQIKDNGSINLFRSHNPDYKDGEQMRDFVYVKDVANICLWLMREQPTDGLYNVGSGKARTFKDLATAIFTTLQLPLNIQYVDTPVDIRDKYQYFTEANMNKLIDAGYSQPLTSLEDGVKDYITTYLQTGVYF